MGSRNRLARGAIAAGLALAVLAVAACTPGGDTPSPPPTAAPTPSAAPSPGAIGTMQPSGMNTQPVGTPIELPPMTPRSAMPTPVQQGNVMLSLDAPSTVKAGQTFSMVITVQAGAQPVTGVNASLNFDPTYLEVVAVKGGTPMPTDSSPDAVKKAESASSMKLPLVLASKFDNKLGTLDYAAGVLLGTKPTGTFALAYVNFRAKAASSGTEVSFSTTPPRLSDATFDGPSLLKGVTTARVTIQP